MALQPGRYRIYTGNPQLGLFIGPPNVHGKIVQCTAEGAAGHTIVNITRPDDNENKYCLSPETTLIGGVIGAVHFVGNDDPRVLMLMNGPPDLDPFYGLQLWVLEPVPNEDTYKIHPRPTTGLGNLHWTSKGDNMQIELEDSEDTSAQKWRFVLVD
ncbi:unnamed protein product [Rhizoctonia solani]|uniref:Uncharacterized protein n=1 Tax=Rhizoctonia solani TaxID=456999 RepID=A0A8H3AQS0_9AGAM|nr:unnamed protein product [Rhizoctonia solani]